MFVKPFIKFCYKSFFRRNLHNVFQILTNFYYNYTYFQKTCMIQISAIIMHIFKKHDL